jgi:glyoxylase-like metal-dependent hydrolase (beta-lactamase superfamily II)
MEIYPISLTFSFNSLENIIYPVIIKDKEHMILVDCGYEGFLPLIEKAAAQQGLSLNHLTGVIITHHDIDHMGGLYELREAYPQIAVYASKYDAPYISGLKKSLRLQQAEDLFDTLPEDQKSGALYFQQMLKGVKTISVDITFSEDEIPTHIKGIQIINTPGHMPGHISIYAPEHKTLIAADALVVEDGALNIANSQFAMNLQQAVASVKKLQQLNIEKIVCYHGGVVERNIQENLSMLISGYSEL